MSTTVNLVNIYIYIYILYWELVENCLFHFHISQTPNLPLKLQTWRWNNGQQHHNVLEYSEYIYIYSIHIFILRHVGWMKYHLFLIHYIFETRSTTTSCHMCVVFCWSSCPCPETKHAMGKWPKHSTNPWRSSHIEVDPHEKLMPSWSWSHAEMGGGHRTWSNGEEPPRWGSTKAGLRQKWRIQDDNSRFWVSYELRGPQRRIMSGETMAHSDSLSDLWVFTLTLRTCVLLRYEVDKN